jgi:hypothetical protein
VGGTWTDQWERACVRSHVQCAGIYTSVVEVVVAGNERFCLSLVRQQREGVFELSVRNDDSYFSMNARETNSWGLAFVARGEETSGPPYLIR